MLQYYYLVFGCGARELLIVKPAANLVIPNTQISISKYNKNRFNDTLILQCVYFRPPTYSHLKTKTLECASLHINHLNSYYRLFIILAAARKGLLPIVLLFHPLQEEKGINSGHFKLTFYSLHYHSLEVIPVCREIALVVLC